MPTDRDRNRALPRRLGTVGSSGGASRATRGGGGGQAGLTTVLVGDVDGRENAPAGEDRWYHGLNPPPAPSLP